MTAPDVGLRDLRWTDIDDVVALEAELFPDDAWTAASLWAELAARPRRSYVVQVDAAGELVGYAGVDLGGEVADVMTMAVSPRAQGRGLGRQLLSELVGRAVADHAAYLMLEVRADNEPARKLYESEGFETLTVRRRYYQPGDVDAHVMRLRLSEVMR
ncbi:ribosomal-protein-alanine N-acetyltransferase [Phycicoccus badiiscoriae]|uniref:Ribosomal-protein-alanine N-acetyltransferase n=1 Tax=Pedococcus badiiscoriae TaxID=642776 RepID=A0A852WQ32_9MICO|nr:ribosomal protein S18-alanine N-acetyltransferase [Pedococcus badiiscoriae]NYG07446.1 ribosomal-protein-alanine N-acetyltransferase [Pedococcus badiiscoriae]